MIVVFTQCIFTGKRPIVEILQKLKEEESCLEKNL